MENNKDISLRIYGTGLKEEARVKLWIK